MDVTELEDFISQKRKEGLKITLTHIFLLAVARAIKTDIPELNTFIRRGKVVKRDHIDVSVSVLLEGKQMSSVKINDADKLTLAELAPLLNEEIHNARTGSENKTMRMKGLIASIPWPFRRGVFRFIKWITIDLGLSFPGIGLSAENYGSFVLTNIGSIGLETGYPALFPISNVAFVLVMGGVVLKPAVVEGQIVPRRILNLSTALDHRVVDAMHGGKLFRYLKNTIKNPQILEVKPGT
jgi:pyruvate/2-oxoglutarate dehydrogenase complex dihydrolipoamide acyltransferase (E2) component